MTNYDQIGLKTEMTDPVVISLAKGDGHTRTAVRVKTQKTPMFTGLGTAVRVQRG
jgi:hypothetical protein